MEDITDADYMHAKRLSWIFVQSDTLLLADVFENFGNMCYKIWAWSFKKLFSPGLAWQATLKKTKVK